ncbi:MAG: hypothetical protein AB1750_19975, partial [Chloroflexota bacterium]
MNYKIPRLALFIKTCRESHGAAFHVGYARGSIGGLIVLLVMLRSDLFGRITASGDLDIRFERQPHPPSRAEGRLVAHDEPCASRAAEAGVASAGVQYSEPLALSTGYKTRVKSLQHKETIKDGYEIL